MTSRTIGTLLTAVAMAASVTAHAAAEKKPATTEALRFLTDT